MKEMIFHEACWIKLCAYLSLQNWKNAKILVVFPHFVPTTFLLTQKPHEYSLSIIDLYLLAFVSLFCFSKDGFFVLETSLLVIFSHGGSDRLSTEVEKSHVVKHKSHWLACPNIKQRFAVTPCILSQYFAIHNFTFKLKLASE